MSRIQIKEFCHAILTDCSKFIPGWCKTKLAIIDIEFTKDNIDIVLKRIYCDILHEKINIGRIISMLGFADVLSRRYSWCEIDMLVEILIDVLIEARFDPDTIIKDVLLDRC